MAASIMRIKVAFFCLALGAETESKLERLTQSTLLSIESLITTVGVILAKTVFPCTCREEEIAELGA